MEAKRPARKIDRSSDPLIVIEGMEDIIQKDLDSHKIILERTKLELLSWRQAVSSEVKKKRHYRDLIGSGKYDDDALIASRTQMGVNITHLQNKCSAAEEKIKFETIIVDTLTEQLKTQNFNLSVLAEHRKIK